MAYTKREQILAQIKTTLDSVTGATVYRSRVEPLSRGEAPAIVVEPVSDAAEQNTSLPTLDWSLTVRIAVIVRGAIPDQIADAIIEELHGLLMADLTVGGLAIDVRPGDVDFDLLEADQPAGVMTCNYVVRYRTTVTDLTTS